MKEKTRFAIVAATSAIAGAAITTLVDRMAMKQDLEFLGIIHHDVAKGVAMLRQEVEEDKKEGEDPIE